MRKFTASRVRSFAHAFDGWRYVLRTQRNLWLQVVIALTVFGVAAWLGLGVFQWAVIVLTTAMVLAAEFFNTAIEVVLDLVSPQEHPLARLGKDVAAAAVLLTALAAVFIGILVLGPPLYLRVQALMSR
jgi:diacylglycerol kinase